MLKFDKLVMHLLDADQPLSPRAAKHTAKTIFENVDQNADGFVQKHELYNYLCKGNSAQATYKMIDRLFADVDKNGDKRITKAEFVKGMCAYMDRIQTGGVIGNTGDAKVMYNHRKAMLKASQPAKNQKSARAHGKAGDQVITVRGSSGMNARSGTRAFALEVVRSNTMKHIRSMFLEIDSDNSGTMDFKEFKEFMGRVNPELEAMSTSIFASLDVCGTGRVTFKQLLRVLYPAASESELKTLYKMAKYKRAPKAYEADKETLEDMELIFQVYDSDGSGTLDREEFVAGMQMGGYTAEEADEMFTHVDTDESGVVTWEEFKVWFLQRKAEMHLLDQENRIQKTLAGSEAGSQRGDSDDDDL